MIKYNYQLRVCFFCKCGRRAKKMDGATMNFRGRCLVGSANDGYNKDWVFLHPGTRCPKCKKFPAADDILLYDSELETAKFMPASILDFLFNTRLSDRDD
jgi:hypothetical protein